MCELQSCTPTATFFRSKEKKNKFHNRGAEDAPTTLCVLCALCGSSLCGSLRILAELTTTLADPELYQSPGGSRQANTLTTELKRLETDLLEAIARRTAATEQGS